MNDEKTIGAVTCVFDALYAYCRGGNEPQVSGADDAPSSSQSGDNTDIQSGEPLVLPLYNRFYLNDSELVLVKDDGSAVIDFEDGYEEESAEVQKQIDAVGQKMGGSY